MFSLFIALLAMPIQETEPKPIAHPKIQDKIEQNESKKTQFSLNDYSIDEIKKIRDRIGVKLFDDRKSNEEFKRQLNAINKNGINKTRLTDQQPRTRTLTDRPVLIQPNAMPVPSVPLKKAYRQNPFMPIVPASFDKFASRGPEVEMVQVFVARKPLEIGDELNLGNITVKNFRNTNVPENAIRNAKDLVGMVAAAKIPQGVCVVEDSVIDKNLATLSTQPPNGYRVFTLMVEPEDVHQNRLQAGDRIDMIGVFEVHLKDGGKQKAPSTFLKNIEVWQVSKPEYKNISVLLTPKQVELAVLAQDVGSSVRIVKTARDQTADDETTDEPEVVWKKLTEAPAPESKTVKSLAASIAELDRFALELELKGEAAKSKKMRNLSRKIRKQLLELTQARDN